MGPTMIDAEARGMILWNGIAFHARVERLQLMLDSVNWAKWMGDRMRTRDGAVRAGGIIRPMSNVNGLPRAAFALWDVREQAVELRGRDYSRTGVDDSVVHLCTQTLLAATVVLVGEESALAPRQPPGGAGYSHSARTLP